MDQIHNFFGLSRFFFSLYFAIGLPVFGNDIAFGIGFATIDAVTFFECSSYFLYIGRPGCLHRGVCNNPRATCREAYEGTDLRYETLFCEYMFDKCVNSRNVAYKEVRFTIALGFGESIRGKTVKFK